MLSFTLIALSLSILYLNPFYATGLFLFLHPWKTSRPLDLIYSGERCIKRDQWHEMGDDATYIFCDGEGYINTEKKMIHSYSLTLSFLDSFLFTFIMFGAYRS